MKKARNLLFAVATSLAIGGTAYAATAPSILTKPPSNFKPVSKLVQLPNYLPGMGTLYVDPSTLPEGPFLGYDHQGKLVDIIYMVPLKDLDAHKKFDRLGASLPHLPIDHTDIDFNPGHAGVPDAHYHITQWLISPQQQQKLMQ